MTELRREIVRSFGSIANAADQVGVSYQMLNKFVRKGYVPPSYIEPLGIDPSFAKHVPPGRKTDDQQVVSARPNRVNVSQLSIEEAQRIYRELHAMLWSNSMTNAITVQDATTQVSEIRIPPAKASGYLAWYSTNINADGQHYWMMAYPTADISGTRDTYRCPYPLIPSREEAVDAAAKMLPNCGCVRVVRIEL